MKGNLDASGQYQLSQIKTRVPMTVTLVSAAGSIELSTNGGDTFFTPVYDIDDGAQVVVAIAAPITDIRITGAEGDAWEILL